MYIEVRVEFHSICRLTFISPNPCIDGISCKQLAPLRDPNSLVDSPLALAASYGASPVL
jgi:hypothetical protein